MLDAGTFNELGVYEGGDHGRVEVANDSTGEYSSLYLGHIEELIVRGYLTRRDEFIRLTPKGRGEPRRTAQEVAVGKIVQEKDRRKVMVVCGRNQLAIDELFAFLRAIDLQPAEWSTLVKDTRTGAPYVGEVLDRAFVTSQAVVVFATPDDVATLRTEYRGVDEPSYETELTPQVRPNVLFEAGLAFGSHPARTILVELGTLRPVSDLSGRHAVRLNGHSGPLREIAMRLKTAGCAVDLEREPWHRPRDYPNLDPSSLPRSVSVSQQPAFDPPDASLQRSEEPRVEAEEPPARSGAADAPASGPHERLRQLLREGRQLSQYASAAALGAVPQSARVTRADADVWAGRVVRLLRRLDAGLVAHFEYVPPSERLRFGAGVEITPRFLRRLERRVANLSDIVEDLPGDQPAAV